LELKTKAFVEERVIVNMHTSHRFITSLYKSANRVVFGVINMQVYI